MTVIKKGPVENAEKFVLTNKLWGSDAYDTEVYAQISYDDEGFVVKFTVAESNPLRKRNQHLQYVHNDSCVEFFANFDPENSPRYINFETNAAGVMNASFKLNKDEGEKLKVEDLESFHITPDVQEDHWTTTYKIGYDFIKKYYPGFDIAKCSYIKGNLYKCGDETAMPHFISYFDIPSEEVCFHRPEFFGEIKVIS